MPAKIELPRRRVVEALQAAQGITGLAARILGVSRQTLHRRIESDPRLLEALQDQHEMLLEFAWMGITRAIMEGHGRTTIRYLERYGADRGYGPARARNRRLTDDEMEDLMQAALAYAGGRPAAGKGSDR